MGRGGVAERPDVRVAHVRARRKSPEEAVRLGWAHGALLTTFPGDTSMATLEQVESFAKGGSARIQR
jgi:sugar/nucleoside kinase (ribokinase family)